MSKKNIVFLIIILALFIIFVFIKFNIKTSHIIEYVQSHPVQEIHPHSRIINEINNKYDKIKNISSDGRLLIVHHIPIPYKFNLSYEKPRKLHAIINRNFFYSVKEAEVGCNLDNFWYWIKVLNPQEVYYASWEDLYNTNLKTPFNPIWIMDSLGLNAIHPSITTKYYQMGEFLIITENKISTELTEIKKSTVIDYNKKLIVGNYITNCYETEIIASSEILEFQNIDNLIIPKIIQINLYREQVFLTLYLDNVKVNTIIDQKEWNKPPDKISINIGS